MVNPPWPPMPTATKTGKTHKSADHPCDEWPIVMPEFKPITCVTSDFARS